MKPKGVQNGILLFFLLLVGGCTVGPDYVRPQAVPEMPPVYGELDGWKLAEPRSPAAGERWWEIYQDPVLSKLVAQVVISNQNVALAEARFRQARALVRGAKSGAAPNLSAGAAASRIRLSENADSGMIFSNYQLPLDFSWELDLWGRVRRSVESGEAELGASGAELAAASLSAQAELANVYFQLRVVDAQRELLTKSIDIYQKSYQISDSRYAAGTTTKVDVLQAETQLKSTEAQLLDLGVQRAQLEHAIALLIGQPPSAFSLPPAALATDIPVMPTGVPSELLERRPDIAAAERRMAAANARIGVAQAAYYPTIRLSAGGGLSSSELSSLFDGASRFWSLGPTAALRLLDGGLRKSQSEEARAVYDATVASYRGTLLEAFREVEDSLAALRILEREAEVQNQALRGAQEVVAITTHQYEAGTVGYLNVLVNQTIALNTERTVLGIHARRLSASVQLVKALGGDWSAEPQP